MNAAVKPAPKPTPKAAPVSAETTPFEDNRRKVHEEAKEAEKAKAAADAKAKTEKTSDKPADATTTEAADKDKDKDKDKSKEGDGTWSGFFQGIFKKIGDYFGSFKENGGIGSIIGGVLGLAGAWLAGNFFGGGILSTVLTIALAIPFMLAGSDAIGGWINGLLGGTVKPGAGDTPEHAQSHGRAVAKTKDDLNQKLATIDNEVLAYSRVAQRRIRAGQLPGYTLEQVQAVETAWRTIIDKVRSEIPASPTAAQIKQLDSDLNIVTSALDKTLTNEQKIRAEVRTEYDAIQSGKSAAADAPAAKPTATPVGPAKALTNEELNAIIAAPDNRRDRVKVIPNGNNAPTVISAADSEPASKLVARVDTLRDIATRYESARAAYEGRAAQPITGITFTPLSDGNIRIVGTTVGTLPTTGQSR